MKQILLLMLLTGLSFFLFLNTLILGLKRKNKRLKLLSFLLFVAFVGLMVWTGYKAIKKVYSPVAEMLIPRTGDEIYEALFGKRSKACVKVLNYQDQVIPKIDCAILMHFETCPEELKRILSLHDFKSAVVSIKDIKMANPIANTNWFKPETLGDSILVFTHQIDEYGNGQYLYCSTDSARVYVSDILD